jgi:hypothetical protein
MTIFNRAAQGTRNHPCPAGIGGSVMPRSPSMASRIEWAGRGERQ